MKYTSLFFLVLLILSACSTKEDSSDAYGNFEATEIIISSEVSGKILHSEFEEGQQLKEGDVVLIIDSTDIILKKNQLVASRRSVLSGLANVEAQIQVYNQQRKNISRDEKRIENLLKENAATQKQMDDISGQLLLIEKQSNAVKTQKQNILEQSTVIDEQIRQTEETSRKCIVKSPIEATLLTKYAEANELALPGKPLFKIANMDLMKLRVYVSGEQLASIKEGQEVVVLVDDDSDNNRELRGVVSWVSPEAEFTPKIIQTKKERVNMVYAVKILVENDGFLKIGMPGEVRFE